MNKERVEMVVLAWLWCQQGKAKKAADVAKAVTPLLPEGSDPLIITTTLESLSAGGFVDRLEPRKKGAATFAITPTGQRRAGAGLGLAELPPGTTAAKLPKMLASVGVGLMLPATGKPAPAKLLQVALIACAFELNLPLDQGDKAVLLAMVKLALARSHGLSVERIHLKKLPAGELPALVVAPMLGQSGSAASKLEKLIEATALKVLGISSVKMLEPAIVRWWIAGGSTRAAANKPAELPITAAPARVVDLRSFSQNVLTAGRAIARDGGPGLSNLRDKVLIQYAWRRFGQMFGAIELDQFKRLLLQANRNGVILACEDLITDARRAEFAEAEIRLGTSSYHYIRLD